MTDKVQKIREEVERLFNHVKDSNFESDTGAFYYLKDLLDFIDSLQEGSANIWHNIEELSTAREYEYILVIYKDTTAPRVAGNKTQVFYWDRVDKWAYFEDILKLSNVQRTVKNWKEPINDDLEKAAEEWDESLYRSDAFKAGAKWLFEKVEEVLLSEVLPCFMHGGEADEVVAKLDEVLNFQKK